MADNTDLVASPSRWSLLQIGAVCAFSSVGYCGFSSLPYYVYQHTALFFVAFYLLLVLVCIPVCYVQIKLGALYKKGVIGLFSHLVPILKGVAVALLIMTYFRSITHALEISYGVFYMLASCQQPFPWILSKKENRSVSWHEAKITIFDDVQPNPEDDYFRMHFLQRSLYIASCGTVVWYIVLCVLVVWVLVYLMLMKGSQGFVKLMTFLAPATGFLLLVLLTYGYAAVPGAKGHLYQFFNDDFTNRPSMLPVGQARDFQFYLSQPRIWLDALDLQVYGLGLWTGSLCFLGTHVNARKKVLNATWVTLLLLYSMVPHLVLAAVVPYVDPSYRGGSLEMENGVKPGLHFLFVSVPHTFSKHKLSPFMAFLFYLTYILVSLQHLVLQLVTIWENVWPSLPKAAIAFFRKSPCLLAAFCFLSFLMTAPYTAQCGIYLYQVVRFYVDRLLFALVIFSMVPMVIGFVRQEALRAPIDRIFMGFWYSMASLMAACLLIYNFVVYVYPESIVSYDHWWAEHLGWCISTAPLLIGVLLGALHSIATQPGSFKERLLASIKTGSPPAPELGEDGPSTDTGDTDLKTPGPSRHSTPLAQARAPLLQKQLAAHATGPQAAGSTKQGQGQGHSPPHTLFPTGSLPTSQALIGGAAGAVGGACSLPNRSEAFNAGCINSPTCGRGGGGGGGREGGGLDCGCGSAGCGGVGLESPGFVGHMGYGTLQAPKAKANVEVVMRSASDGNVARL